MLGLYLFLLLQNIMKLVVDTFRERRFAEFELVVFIRFSFIRQDRAGPVQTLSIVFSFNYHLCTACMTVRRSTQSVAAVQKQIAVIKSVVLGSSIGRRAAKAGDAGDTGDALFSSTHQLHLTSIFRSKRAEIQQQQLSVRTENCVCCCLY